MAENNNIKEKGMRGVLRDRGESDAQQQLNEFTVFEDVTDTKLDSKAYDVDRISAGDEDAIAANPLLAAKNQDVLDSALPDEIEAEGKNTDLSDNEFEANTKTKSAGDAQIDALSSLSLAPDLQIEERSAGPSTSVREETVESQSPAGALEGVSPIEDSAGIQISAFEAPAASGANANLIVDGDVLDGIAPAGDTGDGTGDDDTGDDDTGDDDQDNGNNNGNNGNGDDSGDGNNGHGNDPDGEDDSNPGNGNGNNNGNNGNGDDTGDGNNGHGNDPDGQDDSNPGNGNNSGNNGNGDDTGDGNNGHGNDPDGEDDSNPGNSNGNNNGNNNSNNGQGNGNDNNTGDDDGNNGHGNDPDGVDDSNPGQGQGGPNGEDQGEVEPPLAAITIGNGVELVSVNDWYNPNWGGGYNAAFKLTLTADMIVDNSVEGWSLNVGLDNADGSFSTGWLDGFNGSVSFDPQTGTFTNADQNYQPTLEAGDTIQFSVQVQNTGFNADDFSFSFDDLDPVLDAPDDTQGALPEQDTGTVQGETITGGNGKDDLVGTDGDDILDGGNGKDDLTGGGGDDILYGGNSQDTAHYSGAFADYNISENQDGSFTIQDTVAGRDGTDTVYETEFFAFNDQTLGADSESWLSAIDNTAEALNAIQSIVEGGGDSWMSQVEGSGSDNDDNNDNNNPGNDDNASDMDAGTTVDLGDIMPDANEQVSDNSGLV